MSIVLSTYFLTIMQLKYLTIFITPGQIPDLQLDKLRLTLSVNLNALISNNVNLVLRLT